MISDDGKTDIGVHFFSICVVVEVSLLFCVRLSEFSHFYKPAIEKSSSHIMTLFSFPSSSLLTPAVSCWYTVTMFGIWTQYWWYFIRVEQIALFSSPSESRLQPASVRHTKWIQLPQCNNQICWGCARWTTVLCVIVLLLLVPQCVLRCVARHF